MGMNFPNNPTNGQAFAPVGGPEYVFSEGAWIQVEGVAGPITGAAFFNSRAQAIASTIPLDVPSITLKGYYEPNDYGGANYSRVIVPPTSHTAWFQSADGAYWEMMEPGDITLEMFGGKADALNVKVQAAGTTDNWDALQAALYYHIYNTNANVYNPAAGYSNTASIRFGRGYYFISKTTEIDWTIKMTGAGGAAIAKNTPSTTLIYPENVTAFIFWSSNTLDPRTGAVHGKLAYGSIIENIGFRGFGGTLSYAPRADGIYPPNPSVIPPTHLGGYNAGSDGWEWLYIGTSVGVQWTASTVYAIGDIRKNAGHDYQVTKLGKDNNPNNGDFTKHGIIMYTTICMARCSIVDFAGDGIHINTSTPGGGTANELSFYDVKVGSNGHHGMYIEGGDTNAGAGFRCDFANSGGFGLWDSSAYGNLWAGCHFDSNGTYARVNYKGDSYFCVNPQYAVAGGVPLKDPGQTEPGTDPSVWEYQGPGAGDLDWVRGNKYVAGGSYSTVMATTLKPDGTVTTSAGLGHIFLGCYMEGPQGSPRLNSATIVMGGGNQGSAIGGQNISAAGALGSFGARQRLRVGDPEAPVGVNVMLGLSDLDPITLSPIPDISNGMVIGRWNDQIGTLETRYDLEPASQGYTSNITKTPLNAGRGAGLAVGNTYFPRAIFLGSTQENMRLLSNNPAKPTIGPEYAKGDISFNTSAGVGNNAGWVATQGGVVSTTKSWAPTATVPKPIRLAAGGTPYTYNGKHYRVYMDGNAHSIVEPIHTSGSVTGSDGFEWTYLTTPATTPVWTAGTKYEVGDIAINQRGDCDRVTKRDPDWISKVYTKDFVIFSTNKARYKCTKVGTAASTVVPTHLPPFTSAVGANPIDQIKADGYGWTYLGMGSTSEPQSYVLKPLLAFPDGYTWEYLVNPYVTQHWQEGSNYFVDTELLSSDEHAYTLKTVGPERATLEPPRHDKTVMYPDGYGWAFKESSTAVNPGNVTWVSGTNYTSTLTSKSEVRTIAGWVNNIVYPVGKELTGANGFVYRCMVAGKAGSIKSPMHLNTQQQVIETDGYKWKYIGLPTKATWLSGQDYWLRYEVVAPNGFLYTCTLDPGLGIKSTVAPTHSPPTLEVVEADGYKWKYVGNLSSPLWVADTTGAYTAGVERISTNGCLYRCTVNPLLKSTSAPTHVGLNEEIVGSDFYQWKHLATTTGAAWVTNTAYKINSTVKMPNGHDYQVTQCPPLKSITAPTHTGVNQEVVGPDLYKWKHLATTTGTDWVTGTPYGFNDIRKMSNGHDYQVTVSPPPNSSVAPSHETGEVTGADGYAWLFLSHAAGGIYICTVDPGTTLVINQPTHTSGTVDNPPVANGGDGYSWAHEISTWVTGTNYALNIQITTTSGRCYQCTDDPAGVANSTIEPAHTSGEVINPGKSTIAPVHLSGANAPGADGYVWTYLATATGTAWAINSVYTVGAIVKNATHDYQLTSRPAGDGYGWTLITNFWPTWVQGTNYVLGNNVTALDGKRYRLTEDAPAGVVSTITPTRSNWIDDHDYSRNSRVVSSTGLVYQCSTDPSESIVAATHITVNGIVTGTDGWGWKHLATTDGIAWVSGTVYVMGAIRKMPNGHDYEVTTVPVKLSTTEPTHLSGTILNAAANDGYGWTVIGDRTKQIVEIDGYGWTALPTWTFGNSYASQAIVISSNNRTYKATVPGPAQPSLYRPTHSDKLLYTDGYVWHHLNSSYVEWGAFGEVISQQDVSTNENLTLVPQTTPREVRHIGTLSTNRTVTLDSTLAYDGMRYRITRTGDNINGVWTLSIGGLVLLRTGDWCDVTYNSANAVWYLSAFGQLSDVRNQQTINDDAAFTINPNTSPQETKFTATLTAARAVTVLVTGAFAGQQVRITRTGSGAFPLNLTNSAPSTIIKALMPDTWATLIFDGTVWYLGAFGSLQ